MSNQLSATEIGENLSTQRARIAEACARVGRAPSEVTLVAVSKTKPNDALRSAYAAGQRAFGENYVQEWQAKATTLAADMPDIEWHFIGHIQSNKAKPVAEGAGVVHTVDRAKLVKALNRSAQAELPVLIEVNIGGEGSKHGCPPDGVVALALEAAATEYLTPVGLMTVAPFQEDPEDVRPFFARMRALRDDVRKALRDNGYTHDFNHLSMGMSHDMEVAVEEGATLVRVGTAIFGSRSYA